MKGIHYTLIGSAVSVVLGAYLLGGKAGAGIALCIMGLVSLIGAPLAQDILNDKY